MINYKRRETQKIYKNKIERLSEEKKKKIN